MTGTDNKIKNQKGMTLLEALVSTAIVGIGFVAVFQMVNYSVQSIDVSGERTKANYLVSMVAEDLIAEKNSDSPTNKVTFMDYLLANKNSSQSSWRMGSCSSGSTSSGSFNNAAQNKFKKWDDRFSTRRIKCKGAQDIKYLKVYALNSNKIKNEINWKAKIKFRDGLEKTFLWYLENINYFKHLNKKDILNRLGLND